MDHFKYPLFEKENTFSTVISHLETISINCLNHLALPIHKMGNAFSFLSALLSRKCNCMEVINDVSFKPPCPCTCRYISINCHYSDVISSVAGRIVGHVYIREQAFRIPDSVYIFYLPITSDISICCMHIKQPQNRYLSLPFLSCRGVIIYSHANATDCGGMLPRCMQISSRLSVDVLIYDYEGYGYSDGCHSEFSMCRDLEEVFKYALGIYTSDHIFLYGESSTQIDCSLTCSW